MLHVKCWIALEKPFPTHLSRQIGVSWWWRSYVRAFLHISAMEYNAVLLTALSRVQRIHLCMVYVVLVFPMVRSWILFYFWLIWSLSMTSFLQLYSCLHQWRIERFRLSVISQSHIEKLILTFIPSLLDYRDSLDTCCSKKSIPHLHLVKKAASWLFPWSRKCVHITPLHWLLVYLRIDPKKIF